MKGSSPLKGIFFREKNSVASEGGSVNFVEGKGGRQTSTLKACEQGLLSNGFYEGWSVGEKKDNQSPTLPTHSPTVKKKRKGNNFFVRKTFCRRKGRGRNVLAKGKKKKKT